MRRNNCIIGINVEFPKGDSMELEKLNKILANKTLGTEFFTEFKNDLYSYDLGIFVLGYLIGEGGDKIKANEKEDGQVIVI